MSPIAILLVVTLAQTGDDPGIQEFDAKQSSLFLDFYKKEISQYEMLVGDKDKLELRNDPVFRFASPIDSNFNGTLFVWTRNGRAEVISSVWAIPQKTSDGKRRIVHEFQSLATSPIKAEKSGEAAWSPAEAGIDPQPVPSAPKPAATAELRLIQIRALAREFSATEIVGEKSDELRMLPQPIYRYAPETKDQPDGAVFALLNEFDPEVFLIIEERSTPNGMAWHFAFARFCRLPIVARHKDTEVWTCAMNNTMTNPQSTHYCNFGAALADWNLPTAPEAEEQQR